mgnify:CR=1 FL=1
MPSPSHRRSPTRSSPRSISPPADPLDQAAAELRDHLRVIENPEADARRLVELLAVTWGGSLAVRHGDAAVADAWIDSRIRHNYGHLYGTLSPRHDLAAIANRAVIAG